MKGIFTTLAIVSNLLISNWAKAVPSTTCGQVRPDLKTCIISWGLPSGEKGTNLALQYASGESYSVKANSRHNAEGQGVSWYWGSGTVRGNWMELWLRVDYTPTALKVYPAYPPTAKLFFRNAPSAQWMPVPGTSVFNFNLIQ